MTRDVISHFETGAVITTDRGPAAMVEYEQIIVAQQDGVSHELNSRQLLMLARRNHTWRVVWQATYPA